MMHIGAVELRIHAHTLLAFPTIYRHSLNGSKSSKRHKMEKRAVHRSVAVSASAQTNESDNKRRSANYHPNVWGDYFLSYASTLLPENDEDKKEHNKLKEEIKMMMITDNSLVDEISINELLILIDAIKHLGVSYHFEREIDQALKQIFFRIHDHNLNDLYIVSLRFRLLRQQGYKASCDIFHKFKDTQGNFKDSLTKDVKGLLGLYEASHLRLHGEDVLEEALAFSTTHLGSAMATQSLNPTLAKQITHALKQPIHKGLQRLEARHYIPIYEEETSRNKDLLTFTKLDFNMLQRLHQYELSDITRWWKGLDFARKLPFARDRLVECYFWALAVYFEPEYFLARRIFTKVSVMTSVMDDIFDVYGTVEELELLSDAIERWDISATRELPEYMKLFYKALLDVYKEIEEIILVSKGALYCLSYAKEKMKCQARAYLQEAKWYNSQYVFEVEEYKSVALTSTGYSLFAVISFLGMGEKFVIKDAFDWLLNIPKIITASEIIMRFTNDIVSRKFEQERGHIPSCIECYMKQYGVKEEEAIEEFRKQITNAWKDINNECMYPIPVPMSFLVRVLNLCRIIDVLYKDGDGYTHSGSKTMSFITSLLVEPVPI